MATLWRDGQVIKVNEYDRRRHRISRCRYSCRCRCRLPCIRSGLRARVPRDAGFVAPLPRLSRSRWCLPRRARKCHAPQLCNRPLFALLHCRLFELRLCLWLLLLSPHSRCFTLTCRIRCLSRLLLDCLQRPNAKELQDSSKLVTHARMARAPSVPAAHSTRVPHPPPLKELKVSAPHAFIPHAALLFSRDGVSLDSHRGLNLI